MTEIVVFLLTFLVVLLIYELILVRKCKKDKKRKKPIEVQYLVNCYNLDLKKVNYKRLLNIIYKMTKFDKKHETNLDCPTCLILFFLLYCKHYGRKRKI